MSFYSNYNLILSYFPMKGLSSNMSKVSYEHSIVCNRHLSISNHCLLGELGRLRKFWLSGPCFTKNRIGQSSDKLEILNFTSAFILLATGIVLGGLLLILEHAYFRFGRKCLKKYDKWGCCALVSLVGPGFKQPSTF